VFPGTQAGSKQGGQKHYGLHEAGRAIAPNLAIECNAFRIPLAGGIDGANP